MAGSGDHCVESVMIVGGVVNCADCAVGFLEGVRAFYYVAVADFVLGFLVSSMGVGYSVVEFVFWIGLKMYMYCVAFSSKIRPEIV